MKFRHVTLAAATGALMLCGVATAAAEGAPRVTTSDNDTGRSVDLRKESANLTRDMDRKATVPLHMARHLLQHRAGR
ncbi:hypothetical protein ACWD6I_31905 [Streptomyces sp. NPDC002454]